MKVTLGGFDPQLGEQFAQDHGSFVMLRARQSQAASAQRPPKRQQSKSRAQLEKEMPNGLDAQQQHEWMMGWLKESDL